MSGYCEVQVGLDPDQLQEYPGGVCIQEIEVIFTDDPERPSWRAAKPVVCLIDARRARELACQLVALAGQAEHLERIAEGGQNGQAITPGERSQALRTPQNAPIGGGTPENRPDRRKDAR